MRQFLNKHSGKLVAMLAVTGIVLFFLLFFSGIQYPFLNARASLNGQLQKDFGITLPASSVIEESYWVGSHDPENVFKIQIDAQEIGPFVDSIKKAAESRHYNFRSPYTLARFGPAYRTPPWWNAPALPDAAGLDISVPIAEAIAGDYRLLYSPSSGKLYLVWGHN